MSSTCRINYALIVIGVITLVLTLCGIHYTTATVLGCFLYPFSHANIVHWTTNAICVYCIRRQLTSIIMVRAYLLCVLVAFIVPINLPAQGFSGIIFYAIGSFILRTSRINLLLVLSWLIIGFFFKSVASSVHLSMFLLSFIPALITDYKSWISK